METKRLDSTAGELADAAPVAIVRKEPSSPMSSPLFWFAAGLACALAIGFFLDSRHGSERRHAAYDKAMSAGRRAARVSAGKARHVRNVTAGAAAEIGGAVRRSRDPERRSVSV